MVSEVENVLNGQIVRKVNADKAIGVSTANLKPDEKGELPLSKQSAFTISSVKESDDISENLDLTPPTPDPEILETLTTSTTPSEYVPEDVKPAEDETIEKTPVEVASPDGLGSIDFDSLIPNIPLVEDKIEKEPEIDVQEEKVELPQEQEMVQAEEPVGIDDGLFVGSSPTEQADFNPNISTAADAGELSQELFESEPEPVQAEELKTDSAESEMSTFESATQGETEYQMPFDEGNSSSLLATEEPVQEESEFFPEQGSDVTESYEPKDFLEEEPNEAIETFSGEESKDETESVPEEEYNDNPIQDATYEEKFNIIIDWLKIINSSLNEIINKLELRDNIKETPQQVPELPQDQLLEPPKEDYQSSFKEQEQEKMVDESNHVSEDDMPIKGGMFI